MAGAIGTTQKKHHLPHFGMRIVKTGLCVFFCLLLHYFFSTEVALVSSLAAIVTMQSSLQNTLKTGIGRAAGTLLGGAAGIAMLPLAMQINVEGLYVILMPIGMIFVIYLCICLRIPEGVSICAYVYITVLVTPLNSGGDPYLPALLRIVDTAVGVAIALLVNRYIAPPKPKAPSDVQIPANPFHQIYDSVRDRLPGVEQLVLVDTRLIDPQAVRTKPEMLSSGVDEKMNNVDTVSIPVPTTFKSYKHIHAVYIGPDYSISTLSLPQHDGYVSLPDESYPVTIGWHVEPPGNADTYGLLHHEHRTRSARILRRAGKPVSGPLRQVRVGASDAKSASDS